MFSLYFDHMVTQQHNLVYGKNTSFKLPDINDEDLNLRAITHIAILFNNWHKESLLCSLTQ